MKTKIPSLCWGVLVFALTLTLTPHPMLPQSRASRAKFLGVRGSDAIAADVPILSRQVGEEVKGLFLGARNADSKTANRGDCETEGGSRGKD
jgi:hypothetical protein